MELNISSPGNRRPRPAEAAEESEAVRGAPDGRACARQGAQLRVGDGAMERGNGRPLLSICACGDTATAGSAPQTGECRAKRARRGVSPQMTARPGRCHRARAGLAPHKPAFHSSSGSMISRQGWASSYSIASSVETSMITSYRPAARHSISDTWLWPCRHRVGSARLRFSGVWPIHRVLWVSWRYSC